MAEYPKYKYTVKKVIQSPESIHPSMILKIKDMPNANDRIKKEVAKYYDLKEDFVNDIVNFMGRYTADIIREGNMESVMLPHFGKFAPNMKMLQAKTKRIREVRNGKYMLELALRGKNINFIPQINPINYATPTPEPEIRQEDLEEIVDQDDSDDDLGDDTWMVEEENLQAP